MNNSVLEISGLTKRYGKIRALDQLSLSVPSNSVYGILGPNGSGKTTTLSIILGAVYADSGTFTWHINRGGTQARKKIGSLLEKPNFLPNLHAVDNLKMIAAIKGAPVSRIGEALKTTGLFERRFSKFKTYSLGMKQRLALAGVILSDPEILVLDEPTNGLDPQGIVEVRELIIKLAQQGKTILLASHILDEVEKVCTHAAILKNGKLLEQHEIEQAGGSTALIEVGSESMSELGSFLEKQQGLTGFENKGVFWHVQCDAALDLAELNKKLVEAGIAPNHLKKSRLNLESAFLSATGGEA